MVDLGQAGCEQLGLQLHGLRDICPRPVRGGADATVEQPGIADAAFTQRLAGVAEFAAVLDAPVRFTGDGPRSPEEVESVVTRGAAVSARFANLSQPLLQFGWRESQPFDDREADVLEW